MTDREQRRRAAIYVRISSDREGRELGVVRQEEDTRALANQIGLDVVGVYRDNDRGASPKSRKPRPQYKQLLSDARDRQFSTILAHTSGRLTRRPREREDLIELAVEHGIRYRYVQSPDFDLNTSSGRRIARMLAANDTGEAEDISERVERSKLQAAERGAYRGTPRPFGYESDGVTLRRAEADALRQAADDLLAGVSLSRIAAGMRDQGLTRPGRGRCETCGQGRHNCEDAGDHEHSPRPPQPVDANSLRRWLLRPRTAGLVEHRGELLTGADGDYVRAEWPAIIDVDTWHAVRARLLDPNRRTTPGPERKYQGSGVYRCGVCDDGTTVKGTSTGRGARPTQPAYACREHDHLSRQLAQVDDVVDAAVVARLTADDASDLLAEESDGPDLAELGRQARSLRERIAEAGDMWESGEITRAERKIRVDRLESRLADVEQQMTVASDGSRALVGSLLRADDVVEAWHAMPPEQRAAVIPLLMTVTLLPAKRGRPRGWRPGQSYFDPESVRIDPPSSRRVVPTSAVGESE